MRAFRQRSHVVASRSWGSCLWWPSNRSRTIDVHVDAPGFLKTSILLLKNPDPLVTSGGEQGPNVVASNKKLGHACFFSGFRALGLS